MAPCLCADSRTGSGGGDTGPSHDPCRHSPVSDIDFPSCLRVKHLLEKSQTINTWECIVGTMGPTKCQSSEAQRNTKDVTKMKGSGSIYAIYILFMPTPCVFLLCTYYNRLLMSMSPSVFKYCLEFHVSYLIVDLGRELL